VSVSSSDYEIDNIAVADAIINDDSGDEEEILHRDFRWETMDNYTGHREVFSCDFGPRNGAENVTLYNVLSCFLTKKSHNKLSEKLIGTQNNTGTPEGIFSHLDHVLGHGHLSQEVKFTQFLTKARKQRSLCV